MAVTFNMLSDFFDHGYDQIIDVRSPAEFADDHIPGAINLPALSNVERAEVGTIYKQVSPFLARKVGASLVLRNVADHIAGPLSDYDGSWRPLVHCWRGGQRSGVFATVLKEIGWRAETIKGGYKSYRHQTQQYLYEQPLPHKIILLDGYTGTAKTDLLPLLQERGIQALDLEGLARHRGSLIGAHTEAQPSQRMFETTLAAQLTRLDPDLPTVLEAESSKIGAINLPPGIWALMRNAPRISVSASIDQRVKYLAKAYDDILRDPDTVDGKLELLRRVRGHAVVDAWKALQDVGDYAGLARALITDHYDPAYAKSRARDAQNELAEITAESLDAGGLEIAADKIAETIRAL